MAHELEIVNGNASMFYVGAQKPWHGLGVQLDSPPSIEEGIRCAGLDWKVDTHPLYANVQDQNGVTLPILTDSKAVIRSTDNKVLGVVGADYTPVQNAEAFAFFQPAIEAGFCALETAGSLREGSRVWALARILNTTHDVVAGDPVNGYFLLSNSHDGSLAIRVGYTGVRVVCSNTLTLAHHNDKSRLVQVRHTKNVVKGLEKLKEIVDWQRGQFVATVDQFRTLAACGVNEETLKAYVTEVFAPEVKLRKLTEESEEKSYAKLLAKIVPLFEGVGAGGQGNNLQGVRGTMWGAYNSITGYLSHERGRDNDTRLDSLWFGLNQKTNQRAYDVALDFAKRAA
jgi:phage/plasmid-like protein (TIGR03299 family)